MPPLTRCSDNQPTEKDNQGGASEVRNVPINDTHLHRGPALIGSNRATVEARANGTQKEAAKRHDRQHGRKADPCIDGEPARPKAEQCDHAHPRGRQNLCDNVKSGVARPGPISGVTAVEVRNDGYDRELQDADGHKGYAGQWDCHPGWITLTL